MTDPVPKPRDSGGFEPGDAVLIALTGQQTLQAASHLKQDLLHALAQKSPVAIDLGGVEAIDAAALQLIVVAKRTASAAGQSVSVTCTADSIAAKQMLALGFPDFVDPSRPGSAANQTHQEGYKV